MQFAVDHWMIGSVDVETPYLYTILLSRQIVEMFLETELVKRPDELSCCVVNLLKYDMVSISMQSIQSSTSIYKYFVEIRKCFPPLYREHMA